MEILLVILAAAIFAYVHWRKQKRGWHILWSAGVPKRPTAAGNGWHIDFPNAPGHLNYVQWFKAHKLAGSITARFTITGGGFVAPEYGFPASLGLIIQRKGERGQMDYRWFSDMAHLLEAGEATVTVPLTVEHWGDVMGGRDPAAFAAALADVESIGFVFGSAGGRGHGVHALEPSRITLHSIS